MDRTKTPARKASIKETGEELSTADWARFEAAAKAARREQCGGAPKPSGTSARSARALGA